MGDVTTDGYFENVLNAMRFWTKRGFSGVDRTPPAFMTMKSKGFDSTDVSDMYKDQADQATLTGIASRYAKSAPC